MGSGRRIVARRGKTSYLIASGGGDGIVADERHQIRFLPQPMQAILVRGFWKQTKHSESLLKRLLGLPERKQKLTI